MNVTVENLEAAALQLQPMARGELIRRLLRTLDTAELDMSEGEWLQSWAEEAERRIQELDSGQTVALDGPATIKMWKRLYP